MRRNASVKLATISSSVKDSALEAMAQALERRMNFIIEENKKDLNAAMESGRPKAMIDRLLLNENRIQAMAEGLRQIKALSDPIGETIAGWTRPNGLQVMQRRVPMGVVGIIYESRPNVTADAIGLCIKTSNAVVLRGGSEAINSNKAIAEIMAEAAYGAGIPVELFNLLVIQAEAVLLS